MRFKTRDVGRITGYTLNFLAGYAANFTVAHTPNVNPTQILQSLGAVTAFDAENPFNTPYAKVNESLYKGIVDAFDTLANAPSSAGKQKETEYYVDFLDGFNLGAIQSANVVYAQTFSIAWGIGYADGFRDGYAAGYADGYRVGLNAGQHSFFTELGKFLGDVSGDIKTVGTAVSLLGAIFL